MLLLVGQGCAQIDFVLKGLRYYVETRDSSFLSLTAAGGQILSGIKRQLPATVPAAGQ
jgi:hypothetical protein